MIAAKNFQSGLQALRQVEFSLLDMHLHYDYDPYGSLSVQDVIDQVRGKIAVITPPAFNRFQHSFGHILRRRLCGRLLQLQMGGGAVSRCL